MSARAGQLFARGEFRAAHELWEEAWRAAAPGAERLRLRALAQAAAACLHAERGNAKGARSLAARALEALESAPVAGGARAPRELLARLRQLAGRS